MQDTNTILGANGTVTLDTPTPTVIQGAGNDSVVTEADVQAIVDSATPTEAPTEAPKVEEPVVEASTPVETTETPAPAEEPAKEAPGVLEGMLTATDDTLKAEEPAAE